ncbi:MAG: urea ABC transporter substrate-binding protein [Planctomycetia bacterium]|jgi:urea transport system substrate-binding protein
MTAEASPSPDAVPPASSGSGWRRWIFGTAALAALGLGWLIVEWFVLDRRPIVVGLLHSQTGPMAVSERSMIDAEVLALEEINATGGLLGRPVRWVIADGGSDGPTFARQAESLIRDHGVSVIFGCWTSASRKSVLPVVENADHLLVYPMAYEGIEQSPNIVYTGAAPNQQITPAVQWCHDALGARRFFLVGSDYIWPRCVNAIATDQIRGFDAEVAGEAYVPFGSLQVDDLVRQIAAAQPDVILSSVVGDSAVALARSLQAAGIRPDRTPLVTFSMAEDELRGDVARDMAGHYAAWCYFQSLDRPQNRDFVRRFKARYPGERVTSDVIATAYTSVKLWAQAVREAGTEQVRQVRNAFRHQSLDAAEGIIAIDPETRHAWRPVFIGKIRPDGQFDIVWPTTNAARAAAVRPVPFPISRSRSEWERFVADLHQAWGGRWANPARGGLPAAGGPSR